MKNLKLLFCILLLSVTSTFAQEYYLYVSDAGGFNNDPWQILRYNLDGSNPQVFIDNDFFVGEGVGWPQDILFLEDQGVVLISCLVGGRITKHDANTGAFIEDFAAVAGGPTRMKIGADGYIYVLQWSNSDNKVLRYEQDGTFVDEFTDVGVPSSIGLDWDADGNLYVSSYGSSSVTKFDTNGVSQGSFIDSELSGPTNIHREADGNWVALNWNGGNVKRFDSDGNFLEVVTVDVTQPEGIAVHPITGNYIFGNGGPAQIDEFEADGTFVQSIVASGGGGLLQPNAVVVREATLSVPEQTQGKTMVVPSVGHQFQLSENAANTLTELNAYSVMGQHVGTIDVSKRLWDASKLSEGFYILKGIGTEGSFTQKIVVKH